MRPMTWNDLPSIHAVSKPDKTDEHCLEEIRTVLKKHGKTSRFGITLLHQHFKLRKDELLVEHCDSKRRVLTTKPMKGRKLIAKKYLPTVWRFDGAKAQGCSYCPMYGNQHAGHKDSH